jgi:hypothetical protein
MLLKRGPQFAPRGPSQQVIGLVVKDVTAISAIVDGPDDLLEGRPRELVTALPDKELDLVRDPLRQGFVVSLH